MKKEVLEGIISATDKGYGFFIPDGENKTDFFVSRSDMRGAYNKDRVLCECVTNEEGTHARVLKVLKRGNESLSGTYFSSAKGGYVRPDDYKFDTDVFVPFGVGKRAESGDKVVVKITAYPKRRVEGIITRVLGKQFTKKAELGSILYTFKIPEDFSESVKKEAEEITDEIPETEIKTRLDLRAKRVFTIDGDSAKDFDDAVNIEKDKDFYTLGVHIADVSYFVKEGSKIDKEAYARGTSVYFPESVCPMLPEELCNGVCSLVEGKDRLTLSCIMKVDYSGKVIDFTVTPSVINSKARLTYNKAQMIIDGDEELKNKYGKIADDLLIMNKLKDILAEKRDKAGNIDLDVKESVITIKDGKIEIAPQPRRDAERLIEEFMILANCTVAGYIENTENPFVYRVHEKPTAEKVQSLYDILDGIGIKYKKSKEIYSKNFQTILNDAKNSKAFSLVNEVMLRSMQKAKYSPNNVGHFGLSEKSYCHFTSPIRRYPDLIVHRILKDFLKGSDLYEKYGDYVHDASAHCSVKERNAVECERSVDNYYTLLYLSEYVGSEETAIISGVTNFGIFCRLSCGAEGLVRTEKLKGKRYVLDKKNYVLTNGKYSYKLGQEVKVKILGVNLVDKKAEFCISY